MNSLQLSNGVSFDSDRLGLHFCLSSHIGFINDPVAKVMGFLKSSGTLSYMKVSAEFCLRAVFLSKFEIF